MSNNEPTRAPALDKLDDDDRMVVSRACRSISAHRARNRCRRPSQASPFCPVAPHSFWFSPQNPTKDQRSVIQPVLRPPPLSERDNTPRGTPQRRRRKRDDDFFSFSSCIMPHTPHHFKLGLLTGSSRRKALYIDLYSHCRFKYIYNRKMLSNQILLCVLLVIACSRAGAFAPSSPAKNNFATIMRAEEEGATATSNGVESYVRCGRCQTSYSLTEEQLGKGRGR